MVGDSCCFAYAKTDKIFVAMILMLIFSEVCPTFTTALDVQPSNDAKLGVTLLACLSCRCILLGKRPYILAGYVRGNYLGMCPVRGQ